MARLTNNHGTGFICSSLCAKSPWHELPFAGNFFIENRHDVITLSFIDTVKISILALPNSNVKNQFDPAQIVEICVMRAINMLRFLKSLRIPIIHPQLESYRGNVNCILVDEPVKMKINAALNLIKCLYEMVLFRSSNHFENSYP